MFSAELSLELYFCAEFYKAQMQDTQSPVLLSF